MADRNTRELASLMLSCTTNPSAFQASVLHDWLEENGDPAVDAQVMSLLDWIRLQIIPQWHTRPYNMHLPADLNLFLLEPVTVVQREPVVGVIYSVVAFAVPPVAWCRVGSSYRYGLYVRTVSGRVGTIAPLASVDYVVGALRVDGIPEVVDVSALDAWMPPPPPPSPPTP